MFTRVLVGVDGGPGGRDAVALARVLLQEGGTMKLAHVPVQLGRGESRSVGGCLHKLAVRSGGDLVVVGSSRRGIWGRALLGDDTWATLDHAPCPVAVAPQGYGSDQAVIHRIGVGYDSSQESEHALRVARGLAERLGATVTAFRAVPVPAGSAPGDQAGDVLSVPGLDSEVGYGPASAELAFFSDSVDLLVVGAHDHGPVGRMLHRDTARELARCAGCPLLVVGD